MKKIKFKKKTIIISIIIILIAIFVLANVFSSKESDVPDFETALVEKKTLTTTISSTGKIATESSKNVTSQLTNYKVTGVNVKVGDKVNAGDVICTFDTADLAKTVSNLSATINATNTTSGVTVASAERAVQETQKTRDNALEPLDKAVQNARQDYDNHNAALNTAKSNLQTKQTEVKNLENQIPTLTASVNAAQTAKNEAQNVYTQKEAEYTNAKTAFETAQNDPSQLEILGSLQTALVGATQAKDNAKAELTVKENTLATEQAKLNEVTGKINTLNAEITQLNQTIPGQEANVNAKREVLASAEKAYNDQASTLNNQVANAQGQLDSARAQTSVSTLTVEEQLNAYQKQLAETNLKAPAAGTVTAVNVKAGDYYTGGAVVTIEGIESFIVETEIDEYDIADVTVGMEVVIKTDSTRDEELSGEVISVAPAATGSTTSSASAMSGLSSASMGSSVSSSATYTVKVAINTPNDRLRLGMNAKLNIITQKSTDVFAVPYDAVTVREDGTKFVTIIHGENVEEDIDVTTGLESGYYTEILSDKIQEGETVKIPKIDSTTSADELLNSMGATGGM